MCSIAIDSQIRRMFVFCDLLSNTIFNGGHSAVVVLSRIIPSDGTRRVFGAVGVCLILLTLTLDTTRTEFLICREASRFELRTTEL